MQINILIAHQANGDLLPLQKRFSYYEGTTDIRKESYPHASNFTSYDQTVLDVDDLLNVVEASRTNLGCLLKGGISQPIKNEPRRGLTSPNQETQWICLDFDSVTSFNTIEDALIAMGIGDVSYVYQDSASNVIGKKGLNGHVYMLLSKPILPSVLKNWLRDMNLQHFANDLELAKSGNALRYGLDITTCQNDKLLYTAPPALSDELRSNLQIADNRVLCIPKQIECEHDSLVFDMAWYKQDETLRRQETRVINQLRKELGLAKLNRKFDLTNSGEVLHTNPAAAEVTGIKTERGFVYFNLNGGDSWAYYHPEHNDEYIYNFKGEPVYKTQDLLPNYTARRHKHGNGADALARPKTRVVYGFVDTETSMYNGLVYEASKDEIVQLVTVKNKTQLKDFVEGHGGVFDPTVPFWKVIYDPTTNATLSPHPEFSNQKVLNTFKPSKYMERTGVITAQPVPATIHKVLCSALGDTGEIYEHFLNWLAYIVQARDMTGTAWVLHGTQGTGKGLLYHKILSPLLGAANTSSQRMEELVSEFTGSFENKLLVFVDEMEFDAVGRDKQRVAAKLKNLIVEPTISIRAMYREARQCKNHASIIFASNSYHPVQISGDDRRYNIATFQDNSIQITQTEISQLENELADFYAHLMNRSVSKDLVNRPIMTDAKRTVQGRSQSTIQEVISALKNGDLTYFEDQYAPETMIPPERLLAFSRYKDLIEDLIETRRTRLHRDEIGEMLMWCADLKRMSPAKLTKLLNHKGIEVLPLWDGDTKATIRGFDVVQWKVVPFRGKKTEPTDANQTGDNASAGAEKNSERKD